MSQFEDGWQRYSLDRDHSGHEFALLEAEFADGEGSASVLHIMSVEAAQWLHAELGRMLAGGDNE